MTVFADVYNKTALPLTTAPSLKNDLEVKNTVDINAGSTINAIRNVNINAESGTEVVTESAKEYNIYSGENGTGNVVVTTGHEGNASESANNSVNIDGTINAGIHNSLKMTISGGKLSANESENVNPTVDVTEGADIFDPSTIKFNATATMTNPFLADYNKALSDLQAYTPGSAEYTSLSNQVTGMEKVMATYGFAEKISGTDQYIVYDKIQIPAMELPKIELAGGNIDINTPNLTGNGTLNANAAKELTIDNKTERSLLVNDLTMDTAGGRVYVNDVTTTASGNLKLNTQSNYTPAITVNNTGDAFKIESGDNTFTKAPDIILNDGKKITNSAGSVELNNKNGSVLLNGEIYSLTATKVTTPNGGTIINNTGGLQNVGSDPMYKYTFGSQKFADWLQEAMAKYMNGSQDRFSYDTYERYLSSVYLMVMYYDSFTTNEKVKFLSELAGSSDWYTGKQVFGSDKDAWHDLMVAKYDTAPTEPTGAIVSNGAVSIVAKTLNVNGLIQSGFNKYVGEVDRKSKNNAPYRTNLDDDAVIGDKRYRINTTDAETVYNSETGMYDKVVGIYFNPKTYHILTDPLQVSSGAVYLKAEDIVSTGNGKIIAASGGSDIDLKIAPEAGWSLVMKDINTAKRGDPIIMINGVDYTKSSQYLPNSKAVYAWTGGISYNKIETKRSSTLKLFRWNVGSTKDLVDKINNEKLDVKTISTSEPPASGSTLQNGVFTDNSGDSNYLFTITSNRQSGGKVYGKTSVNSRDLDWFGVITEYTYTWMETTPNYVGTTYRINAAQSIKIQTTNKADSTINVTNESNIIVDGDLGSGANGTVNLTSQYGNITTSADGKITDAKINLDAHENIDVTLGLPENKATELKATTFDNEVKITANTPLKNLDISAGTFLGGKKATVVGTGDISGKITASDLDITTPGNIDITTKLSGKLNATGDNSVTVTQTTGDLKIGKVASKGDVSLAASDGAIINAVDSVFNMTGATDKINAWKAAGIISDRDTANSATYAAREEKTVRLNGLENLFKRWALKDDGTVDETLYRQFVNNTADKTNLTEEQINQLELYQNLKNSNDYGFSQNQLLYAIQEGLLNPKARVTANISDPIITGKNITLNAKSIGKELSPKTYSDLTNIKTLEKLAGVKGGDVTFNSNGSITLKEQSPITVGQSSADDKLNITTQGNTFISGTNDTKFNVNTPINAGDGKVVLMTGNGINASKGITAKDIELYAGKSDLNANLIAGTNDVTQTVTESVRIMTITYYTRYLDTNLFDAYKNLPGFSVKEDTGFFNRTYNLTAVYNPNDTFTVNAINRAILDVKNSSLIYNYTWNDRPGTRTVEKTTTVKNDSVGTLTANALDDININADANLPIKNITSGSNVYINVKGNIVSADENTRVTAPNVNLTATNNIATQANPLNINAENTALRAKYAYIIGNYGKLNTTSGTNFESLNKASGGNESSNNNGNGNANASGNNSSASPAFDKTTQIIRYGLLHTIRVINTATPATTVNTAQNNDLYKVALALSQSPALLNKSGDAYVAAAKAWLNGMGYSEAEEKKIIDLSLEIAFDNRLLTGGIADIINRTLTNRNWRHVALYGVRGLKERKKERNKQIIKQSFKRHVAPYSGCGD